MAAIAALAAVLSGGCRPGQAPRPAESPGRSLTPTYAPLTTSTSSGAAPTTTGVTGSTSPTTATTLAMSTTLAPAAAPVSTSTIVDPIGDLTPSPTDPPPAWADLAGGRLTRSASGYELRVRLGGAVPAQASDQDHTMNVASFYDVDGDGQVDYEVWANLADTGWAGSTFDDRRHTAAFGAQAGVTIEATGDELVLRFAPDRVPTVSPLRWSLASEWGAYAVLSTPAAARDDAPDNDGAADLAP